MVYGRIRRKKWLGGARGYIGTKTNVDSSKTDVIAVGELNYDYCSDSVHPGPPYFTGGDLFIEHRLVSQPVTKTDYHSHPSGTNTAYDGSFYSGLPVYTFPSPTNLTGWGAIGWNRSLPVRDLAGIARFLGELRDAPRMVEGLFKFFRTFSNRRWRRMSPEFWADAYLNNQFGMVPFIGDLLGLIDLGSRVDRELSRLERENGKPIHRRLQLYQDSGTSLLGTQSGIANGGLAPVLSSFCYAPVTGNLKMGFQDVLMWEKEITFEGEFLFHFPDKFRDPAFRTELGLQLMGVIPNLHVMYQLTPWTWLIDWFSSAGAVVSNMTLMNKYHQVAKYAYVMCHEKYTTTRNASTEIKVGPFPSTQKAQVFCTAQEVREYKSRVAASPYGFGLTWDGFSPYQLSILAALGVSKPRTLR